jgi:hypothetical protein
MAWASVSTFPLLRLTRLVALAIAFSVVAEVRPSRARADTRVGAAASSLGRELIKVEAIASN